jgi:copper chaperone CopZ
VKAALQPLPGVASVKIEGTTKAVLIVDSAKFKEEDVKNAMAKTTYKNSTLSRAN